LVLISEIHQKILKNYIKEIAVEKGRNSCYDREKRIMYISLNTKF